jgi:hypothetical protein
MPLAGNSAANGDRSKSLPHAGEFLQNRLCKGALNEIVADAGSSGSATLIREVIHGAANRHQIIALVDGCDSFDVVQMESAYLAQLLWVRCPDAETALKAADLMLRDGNLPLMILDLKLNPETQLRRIPATTWYRFQRLVETTCVSCLVFTPRAMVAPAKIRIMLDSEFSLADLERDTGELLRKMKMEVVKTQHSSAASQKTA